MHQLLVGASRGEKQMHRCCPVRGSRGLLLRNWFRRKSGRPRTSTSCQSDVGNSPAAKRDTRTGVETRYRVSDFRLPLQGTCAVEMTATATCRLHSQARIESTAIPVDSIPVRLFNASSSGTSPTAPRPWLPPSRSRSLTTSPDTTLAVTSPFGSFPCAASRPSSPSWRSSASPPAAG